MYNAISHANIVIFRSTSRMEENKSFWVYCAVVTLGEVQNFSIFFSWASRGHLDYPAHRFVVIPYLYPSNQTVQWCHLKKIQLQYF